MSELYNLPDFDRNFLTDAKSKQIYILHCQYAIQLSKKLEFY